MDNRAGEMQVFLRVVDSGSFSEAARVLRMTPSTVSKLVARMEARLGVRLLERSTRRLSLTAEGQIYYDRSQSLLATLEDIERDLSQGAGIHAGRSCCNARHKRSAGAFRAGCGSGQCPAFRPRSSAWS